VLTAPDLHAQNTFEDPRAVEPRDVSVTTRGAAIVHSFAPASVTRLQFDL
jgi:alpha-N-arabinofuranosidase